MITLKPTIKQYQAWEALKTKDEVFLGGGAGGGKSWLICETRLVNCYLYPGYRSFIGREELKRLMQSTYVTWCKVTQHHNIHKDDWKLNGQYNYIEFKNGSRIDLLDLKFIPSDPLYERFGSLEYSDGAIEEAGEVHPLAKDVLGSRIGRHLNDKIRPTLLITGNPKKNWTYQDYFKPHKTGNLPDNIAFIQSLYSDNPYTADSYKKQLAQIKDKATKERLMFGNWEYDDDPSSLLTYDAIIDLFTNPHSENGRRWMTVDVARYGRDKSVMMLWDDLTVYRIITFAKIGIDQLAEKVRNLAIEEHIPYSSIIADDDGVGGGLVDVLRGIKGFINNSRPLKDENYQNLKTQCYYKLAEMINNRVISIKEISTLDRTLLIEELEQLKTKDADKDNKLRIVPKEEIKEILGRSPDLSDSMMMRMFFEIKNTAENNISIRRPQIIY